MEAAAPAPGSSNDEGQPDLFGDDIDADPPAPGSSDDEGQPDLFGDDIDDAEEDPTPTPSHALSQQLYRHAKAGDAAVVGSLLSGPGGGVISPDGGGEDGFTPLMTAAEAGHDAVVARLLESPGINPNLRNAYVRLISFI